MIVRMTCYTAEFAGDLTASAEIEQYDFFGADDVAKTSDVDHLIFADLQEKGLLE